MQKTLDAVLEYQPLSIAINHDKEIRKVLKMSDKNEIGLDPYNQKIFSAYELFTLGYIAGIRAERHKKNITLHHRSSQIIQKEGAIYE